MVITTLLNDRRITSQNNNTVCTNIYVWYSCSSRYDLVVNIIPLFYNMNNQIQDSFTSSPHDNYTTRRFENEMDITHNLKTFRIVVNVYVTSIICFTGFTGNILSITVLRKETKAMWLLQALAVVDSLYLCACIFIQTLPTVANETDWWPALTQVNGYIEIWAWPCASIIQTITVWMVVFIAVDRYIIVSRPFNSRTRSPKYLTIGVVLICIIATIYNIPRFFERKLAKAETGVDVSKTQMRKNSIYLLVYGVILHFVFRTIGPLTTLIIVNIRLTRNLNMSQGNHDQITRNSVHRNNITCMLIAVVSVFIVCELPDTILRVWGLVIVVEKATKSTNLKYFNIVSNVMLTINSAINFLIYCFIGAKFRRNLRNLFCKVK